MVEGLVKRGLIARRSARHGEPAWAQGGSGLALKITLEGRALVGSTDPSSGDDQPLEPATPPRKRVRPGTKKALLVDLLRRPEGASISEIQQATGWQPHSARAAITGLNKKSFGATRTLRRDATRAYRLNSDKADLSKDLG
jgi:hypothetical protein